MSLGYVVIEHNQASRWPSLYSDALYDSEHEAQEVADDATKTTTAIGRGETYQVARVDGIRT